MTRSRITTTAASVIALVVALLAVTSCDWTQFRADGGRSGYVADNALKPAAVPGLIQKWAAPTGAAVQSSPAIAAGIAYVGSDDGSLYAFNATTGELQWSVATGGAVASSPAVDNGTVYVGSDDHKLHAIRLSDHTELWSATLDGGFAGLSSAPLVQGGVVYASSATSLYAYKPDGTRLWSVAVTASGPLSAPSSANGVVYVSSYADAALWAYRADTGGLSWSTTVPGPRAACPTATPGPLISGGVVYATFCPSTASDAPSPFAYHADTGVPMWSNASTRLASSPTMGFGPLFVISSVNHTLEARSPTDGSLLWSAAIGSTSSSSPALGDRVLYVATDDHKLRAFDATATSNCSGSPKTCIPLWTTDAGGAIRSSPAVSNGFVYVGSDDHSLHAYGLPPSGFGKSALSGTSSVKPTASRFGPDGRLYVADLSGVIRAYTVARNSANSYRVTATEIITLVKQIPNHDDDGTLDPNITTREMTGMLVTGTAANPVIYATSSDPRIGAGTTGGVLNPDTNSGVVSRLTRSGGVWTKVDLVRGLPRSLENHGTNTMVLDAPTNTLFVAQGGNTNMGAPSNNFAFLPEYAYSGAILKVDLAAIGNTTYDLPTLVDEDHPTLVGPFGGDFGKHQAKITASSPVQIYAPGFRNPFSMVKTRLGRLYAIDNGPNGGWGDVPIGAGPGGTCTNAVSEPGTDDRDSLHLITGPGYYGGHANPTRGNRANTFNTTNPQSPVPTANPIECVSRDSTTNGAIATFNSGTTGMAEYTASNFEGQMAGDLIVGSYYGSVFRAHLDGNGNVIRTDVLFSNVSARPLDVAVQGDTGALPGTIWVPDYTTGTIVVFEPNDFGGIVTPPCTGVNSTTLDEDHDGYTNNDEIDNHTDPCSAADLPHDWNHNNISDLHDPDDDSDGLPDTSDAFPIDPANGKSSAVPLGYSWLNGADSNPCAPTPAPSGCPGGLIGLGFTGVMTDGVTDYANLFDEGNMTVGGAAGVLTVSQVPAGDALGPANGQHFGFQFGVNANPATTGVFTIHSRVLAPFSGSTPTANQSIGVFFGTGNQDNFVELAVAANGGSPGIRLAKEVTGTDTIQPFVPLALPGPEAVDLYLTITPSTNTAQASYRVTNSGLSGPLIPIGTTIT
ncbi:MAG: outer membrane protein assembly factor BamB family protein, partial [Acidimicrobiales bacterium]